MIYGLIEGLMSRTADLDAALAFVVGRIEEEATLSSEPLSEQQRLLLRFLPSTIPSTIYPNPEFPPLVPKNLDLERICALGKAAYRNDSESSPSSLDWEFAFAVFNLNRHPMWGVLQQAGVKYRRPWWDGFLLIIAALLFILVTMALMFLVGIERPTRVQWAELGFGYVVILALMYVGSRRIQEWQLEQEIDRCRLASRFVGTAGA
jgi:hypothetical protein